MIWLAFALTAGTTGAMIFFGAVVAPTAFTKLSEEQAGLFVRTLFPRYYLAFGITTLLATIPAFLVGALWSGVLLALICLGFVIARQVLMPAINAAKDAGEMKRFDQLHKTSVYLNMVQLVGLLAALFMIPALV
ncbi:MAG: DUF4149 domain-containing protein [Pseudomonadota bacterium]